MGIGIEVNIKNKVLGIDQSYSNIGFSIQENEKLIEYGSFKIENFSNKIIKRSFIKSLVKGLIFKYQPDIVVVEQIRMFNKGFAKLKPITDLAEMVGVIADAAYPKDLFAVDSRSWKAKVIGDPSADKEKSVSFVKEIYKIDVDHDAADAICISLYPGKNKAILNILS